MPAFRRQAMDHLSIALEHRVVHGHLHSLPTPRPEWPSEYYIACHPEMANTPSPMEQLFGVPTVIKKGRPLTSHAGAAAAMAKSKHHHKGPRVREALA